jgi:hypothetical protein
LAEAISELLNDEARGGEMSEQVRRIGIKEYSFGSAG